MSSTWRGLGTGWLSWKFYQALDTSIGSFGSHHITCIKMLAMKIGAIYRCLIVLANTGRFWTFVKEVNEERSSWKSRDLKSRRSVKTTESWVSSTWPTFVRKMSPTSTLPPRAVTVEGFHFPFHVTRILLRVSTALAWSCLRCFWPWVLWRPGHLYSETSPPEDSLGRTSVKFHHSFLVAYGHC